ncbi:hypothetical protein SDC9_185134 [bioreactor metagenome]|uniref:Uncharacterized protein n=1 Tax=bioreactor metagenome TaxID=1076179 RepID=A0A645HND1_9ZZZZ
MRTAKQKELDLIVDDFLLEIGKIHAVFSVFVNQFADDQFALIGAHALAERVIDGFLNQDGFAGTCQGADQGAEGEDHAGSLDDVGRIDVPAVLRAKPVGEGREVFAVGLGVAEDAVPRLFDQCVDDFPRSLKIHVGDPERKNVRRTSPLDGKIVFEAVGMFSRDYGVEIIGHIYFPSSACSRSSRRSSAFSMPAEMRRNRSLMPRALRSDSGMSA